MKALYIGGFDLPDKNAAAQRVIANAKVLRDIGWEVTLVGLDKEATSFAYECFDCHNLKYPTSPVEWYRYLASIKNYISFLKQGTPQLVIAYNHPAVALRKLVDYCRGWKIKVLSDCTEWYTAEGNIIQRTIKGWDTKKRMEDVHLRMNGVISISRYLHEYYSSKGVKSILLPPLVDARNPKWRVDDTPNQSETVSLIYAGSPGHKDRLDVLVRILSRIAETMPLNFDIVGLDEGQFRKTYGYEGDVPKGIHFHGRLSHDNTLGMLKKSDFQIFIREDNLTTRAGFPTKFVESITAGVPVLTNLTSNIGDYLVAGINGYPLDASSENTLYDSLLSVLQQSRSEIIGMKQSMDRDMFDYRNYVPQIKDFIDKL